MPFCLKLGLLVVVWFLVAQKPVFAVSIAEQTQNFGNTLSVWQAIQELGNNLSGIAGSFTFRVSTSKTNLEQFDYTASNTRIYDKDNNNSYISGCVSNSQDPLVGLTFQTQGVPSGYQDVTIDFSCRNYTFTAGRRYLIKITNANLPNIGVGRILFASAAYQNTSNDYFTGGGVRYAFDNQSCDAASYVWDSQTANSGCNIWTTTKDDLYFVLTNTSPPPKTPVIFIPGIGGSELKANQDIIWSKDDGHGGTFSHAYPSNEKVWVNQDEAAKLGDDDYFDVLRLKSDGVTSEADLSLTGSLTPFGYGDIDSFFQSLGYVKGVDFFVFAYDWRKDIRSTKDALDALIEQAKTASGKTKVNIVTHSIGGLLARYYISDSSKATKVNKLIGLGVPHLGVPYALKTLMYGTWLARDLYIFKLGIVPSEVKDIFQNLASAFQLLPSKDFYKFYSSTFIDDRDIDNDKTIGPLNFNQIKILLSNLTHNMTVFNFGEQFHDDFDQKLNQNSGVSLYHIVGSNQPTLGQIHETWWITWPVNLIPKTDEIFINGDGTVPIHSASLKSNSLDLSAGATIYFVDQTHSGLVSSSGTAMQTVKSVLNESSLPVEVKNQKIDLEGQQISIDDGKLDLYDDSGNHTGLNSNGELETNIPGTFYSTSGKSIHAFIKKTTGNVKVQVTSQGSATTTDVKLREYLADQVTKTSLYNDISVTPTSKAELTINQGSITTQTIQPTAEVSGTSALDQTPPKTTIKKDGSTITLTATDSESGVLKIEYSLDNGKTVKTYDSPFTITTSGKTIVQVKAIDKLGNEEIPQEVTVENSSSSSSSSSSGSSSNSSSSASSTSKESEPTFEVIGATTSEVVLSKFEEDTSEVNPEEEILGIIKEDQKSKNSIPLQQTAVLIFLLPTLLPFLFSVLSSPLISELRPFRK